MCEQLLLTSIPIVGSITAVVCGWALNERSKRKFEEYKRREESYTRLIKSIRGFYIDSQSTKQKDAFLEQLRLCWLYCPDIVINKAYTFLEKVRTGANTSNDEKEKALGEFMVSIRDDLLSRKITKSTDLEAGDFKHLRAT